MCEASVDVVFARCDGDLWTAARWAVGGPGHSKAEAVVPIDPYLPHKRCSCYKPTKRTAAASPSTLADTACLPVRLPNCAL